MNNCLRLWVLIAAAFAVGGVPLALAQGAKPAPKTAKPPAKSAPSAKKPVAPAVVTPAIPPPPPPPSDVRFKTTYVNGEQTTTSATYIGESRERYELGDTILIKQKDQKRLVQISLTSNTYLVTTEGATAAAPEAPPAAAAGVVLTTVAIVDMGERKTAFGHEARRVRTVIDRQPQPGACDQSKVRIETDGWYIDPPKVLAAAPAQPPAASAGCKDEIKATETGDPKLLGFPISYRTTFTEPDSKDAAPLVVAMDITDFEVLKLDAALFEIPAGMTEAASPQQLAKAISDANEVQLAGAGEVAMRQKQPGTLRVGVPEIGNKTSQTIDTRAMRARLVAELEEQKIDVVPMAAAAQPELEARAKALGVDYLLVAEITDLKTSKPGGITRFVKNTAGEGVNRDITEAKLNVQLVPPGGKARLSKTSNGKDGGIGVNTGLGLAKFAGSMYLRMYMGGYASQLSALGAARMMNLGGMNPALMQMQTGLGATRFGGSGFDRTAGAAMYVMQQTMAGASAGGESPGGPSFDAALDDAIQDAGKEVVDSMKKASAVKK